MMFVTLKKMPYAQAKVQILETGENFRCNLVSYTTCVAHIIEGGWLIVNGLYSATTRRHLSAFASEYCGTDYYTLKRCCEQNLAYNIHTKEFFNRETGEVFF
jgi:hypothetical protein